MTHEENWSMVITPKRRLLDFNIKEIIRYRDLIFLFVKRDFTTQYKQTILGPIWFLINPIMSTIIYTFIFGRLAGIGTDGIPHVLFYFSGTLLWTYFTACFDNASNVFISNAGIFNKVYFPRLVVPIYFVLSHIIKTFIQFCLLMAVLIYYLSIGTPLYPSWMMIFFPLLLLWLAAISVGAGIIISSLTTKYRDLRNVVGFIISLAIYASPVVYPISEIPENLRWIAYINPVSAPVELFRQWYFGFSSVNSTMILSSLGISVFVLFTGLILFNQNETSFVDVI